MEKAWVGEHDESQWCVLRGGDAQLTSIKQDLRFRRI